MNVVIALCSLLIGVCVQYLHVAAWKHFIIQKKNVWEMFADVCMVAVLHEMKTAKYVVIRLSSL